MDISNDARECWRAQVSAGMSGHCQDHPLPTSQQTRGVHPMLVQCWASVEDAGPTLKQHRANAPCLLGATTCRAGNVPGHTASGQRQVHFPG